MSQKSSVPQAVSFVSQVLKRDTQMLNITASSFAFDYARSGMRCVSASVVVGSNVRGLYDQCPWTPYQFFLELFRCPIGDPKITSAQVSDLPIPNKLELKASTGSGELGE